MQGLLAFAWPVRILSGLPRSESGMRFQTVGMMLGLALLPLTLQGQQAALRPWQSTDYYRLTVVSDPKVSPDGRRVAFVVTTVVEDKDRRHNEIWVAPSDGSAPAFRYTSPATEATSPTWSPDGSLLAFSSKREGSDVDIWFLRTSAPGGEAFQIKGVHAMPVFSRDGQKLVYSWSGDEPDSLKQQTWRTRVSPAAITHGPATTHQRRLQSDSSSVVARRQDDRLRAGFDRESGSARRSVSRAIPLGCGRQLGASTADWIRAEQ